MSDCCGIRIKVSGGFPQSLATVLWEPLVASAKGERCRWPLDGLPGLDILAGGELDEESAVQLVGAFQRGGVERAGGPICGSAAQPPLLIRELDREHEVRSWSDLTFAL